MPSVSNSRRAAVDLVSLAAVAGVVVSWFWLSTFVTDLGRIQLRFHFYDLWTIIGNPALLLTGIGRGHTVATVLFGLLSLAVALAPLTALLRDTTATRLASMLPLLFMLVCGGWLYATVSPDYFAGADTETIGGQLIDLANGLTAKLVGSIAGRVKIGLGAYAGLIASGYLAFRTVRRGMFVTKSP